MTVQTQFALNLPSVDNGTPPAALALGDVTSLTFQIDGANYSWPVPAATPVGGAVSVPFSALSPVFAPAPGSSHTADVFAVDSDGNGTPTASINWKQGTVPGVPTNFGVR